MSKLRNKEIPTGPTLILVGIFGVISPLFSFLLAGTEGMLAWLIDLAASFQWLYLALLLLGLMLSLRHSRRYLWVITLAPLPWLTAHQGLSEISSTATGIRIISANTNFKNTNLQALKALINTEQPDVVVLLELSPDQAGQLAGLTGYPFQQINPDHSPFGIGVLSRLAFTGVTVDRNWTGNSLNIPTIEVIIERNDQSIKLVAFHPMPPITPEFHTARNIKLKEIVEESRQQRLATIIAGDFNATPWSSAFVGIDYNRATGLQPTWPTRYLGIPVDQVLVSEHWQLKQSQAGPDVGSDHLPVITEVVLTEGNDE